MGRVAGKACVVTGAGSGIGRAIAERLAEEGGKVLCVDIQLESVTQTVAGILAAGGVAETVAADVSDPVSTDAFINRCVELYGSIDILINNAAVNLPGVFHEVTNEIIDRTLNVNVKGPIYGSRAAIPHMLRQNGGDRKSVV